MSDKWRYQIMQDDAETWSVHEVYVDEDDPIAPHSWTEEPIVIAGDSVEEVREAIYRMAGDALRPPLSLYWQAERAAFLNEDET